jgi:hypothetical protein
MRHLSGILLAALLVCAAPAHALGQKPLAAFGQPAPGALVLVHGGRAANLFVDPADHAGVLRAAGDLQADIERVSSVRPALSKSVAAQGADVVLIGTLGKSALIDRLVQSGALDVSSIKDKWEGWLVQTVVRPLPGVERALVIAGSDKRGTIFGIYEMSEQIGVSPWTWWADVPPARHASVSVIAGMKASDAPVVQYRGIFLNDEAPALTNWAKEKFGGYNHEFYVRVFELILRLRGNYLWPAMWGSAFFDDDKENGKLADEYGIVMGTSHHEPMMRAQQEWGRHGKGAWDYNKNKDVLQEFWRGGLRQTRDYEKLITIGMRGDGDEPMTESANVALLERIVRDQRDIIGKEMGADPTRVPQVWALYKEVQEYYEKGMRVPDDVLLLWCDDNWGNIRRLPTEAERKRAGGAGVYYHFDYVGGPRSYKWINVTPIPKIWEQMHLAWRHQADRLWVVNVGDLKPMEIPIEFFLTYAWNPAAWPAERLPEYLRLWAAREFGPEHASEIAGIVDGYTRFNGRRKPEQLEPTTYSLVNYNEAERIVKEYKDLAARASMLSAALPASKRDAFFQLVLHPVLASATLNEMYVSAGLNRLYGAQGRASTNDMAARTRALFQRDAEITRQYQELNGGKWNHMMSQAHIGYTAWNQPERNVMPPVSEMHPSQAADMGVAAEGSEKVWPSRGVDRLAVPALDVFERQPRFIEIFNRGRQPFDFTISASAPWIVLGQSAGKVGGDVRVSVDARWDEVPAGTRGAALTVHGPNNSKVVVEVPLHKPVGLAPGSVRGAVETGGVVSLEAAQYSKAVAPAGHNWQHIPGHGRTLSGMTAFPVDGPAADGMRLEYQVHLFTAGKVTVHTTLAPTLKFRPGQGLRYAVSFDDEAPQVIDVHADQSEKHWARIVSDGAAVFTSSHVVARPGAHTLKFWSIDPGLVLQKMVIDAGGLRPSYLGPPPSPRF